MDFSFLYIMAKEKKLMRKYIILLDESEDGYKEPNSSPLDLNNGQINHISDSQTDSADDGILHEFFQTQEPMNKYSISKNKKKI